VEEARDIAIIGGGPAGLTAGIYTRRSGVDSVLLERELPGGQAVFSPLIENYPGFPEGISGAELMAKMKEQASRFGLELRDFSEVRAIEETKDGKRLTTDKVVIIAKAVIVATGRSPRKLGIPGEEEFTGRGISYCATCDGPLFKDKEVMVVGGGDAAVEEALHLTRFAKRVILVHRRGELRASSYLEERARNEEKLDFMLNSEVREIKGDKTVNSAVVENNKTGERNLVPVSGVFVYVGNVPNTKFLEGFIDLDEAGYIITNGYLETSVPGIFAAGDVRSRDFKQVVVSAGEGALAAASAMRYLEKIGAKEAYEGDHAPQ